MELKDIRNKTVDLLNECLITDKEAISKLVNERVVVSETLADHPIIQVRAINGDYLLGILGILNGILSEDNEFITAEYLSDEDVLIDKFKIIKRLKK